MKYQILFKTLAVAGSLAFLSGCGDKIPSSYQGTFQDANAHVSVQLRGGDGDLSLADGRVLKASAQDGNFATLSSGKPGIYMRPNSANSNYVDVIWLNPNVTSKQSNADIVWFQTEILYMELNTKQGGKIEALEFTHCLDGAVEFDTTSKALQFGCPVGAQQINAVRVNSAPKPSNSAQMP